MIDHYEGLFWIFVGRFKNASNTVERLMIELARLLSSVNISLKLLLLFGILEDAL